MTDEYDTYIDRVLEEVPDADRDAVLEEFKKYHVQFRIEPEDAVRSIMKRFQKDDPNTTIQSRMEDMVSSKKAERFSELASDDRNVTIEVAVVTYTPRMQKMKSGKRDRLRLDGSKIFHSQTRIALAGITRIGGIIVATYLLVQLFD